MCWGTSASRLAFGGLPYTCWRHALIQSCLRLGLGSPDTRPSSWGLSATLPQLHREFKKKNVHGALMMCWAWSAQSSPHAVGSLGDQGEGLQDPATFWPCGPTLSPGPVSPAAGGHAAGTSLALGWGEGTVWPQHTELSQVGQASKDV